MVGRSGQLAVVDGALSGTADKRGGLLLVTGEAGIGKTLLARAARDHAESLGLRVAHGYAVDDQGVPVLWPWRRVARQMPELEHVLAAVSATDLDDDAHRFGVWQAVADALILAGDRSGLLVLLEDLHWADSLTVALLRHVAFDLPHSRVVVLATAREDPATPFGRALPDLLRSDASVPIGLSGLDTDDVVEWLSQVGATAGWRPLAAELVRRTDGNPFLIGVLTSQPPPTAGLDQALADRHGIGDSSCPPCCSSPTMPGRRS